MHREFHIDNHSTNLCGGNRKKLSNAVLILIWLLTVSIVAAAKSSSPSVSLSSTSLYFGYFNVGTTGGPENLFVTNSGSMTLTITSITLTGVNAGDFSQKNNCGKSLAPGAGCLVQVMFMPSAPGTRTTTLNITDNATGSPQKVTFSGTATAATPGVSLSSTSLYFGYFNVGATGGPENLFVTNSGNGPLTITSLILSGTNASNFAQTNNCSGSLAAGATCMVQVTFKPSVAGTLTTTLNIADNATGSPQAVIFSGTATATPAAPATGLSPSSLTFASQTVGATSPAQTVTLSNSGNAALSVSGLSLSGANPGDFVESNNCGTSVAAGANCTISVTFTPSASGSRTATLSIADNASGSPQTVSLSGTGTASAASVSPSSLTFASQTVGSTSAAQTVTLSNSGNAALSVSGLSLSGANSGDFVESNNCGASVAAGANCTISVTFTPSASGGRAASLTITDGAAGSPQTVSLSGTGISATGTASLSSTSLTFSNQPVQVTSAAQTVTLTNTGTTTLNITSFALTGANASDFVQNNNCGTSVAAAANCTIVVLFTPSAIGTRTAALSITDNASGSPQSASLSGTGSHDVILSWTASPSSGVTGYNIYRGTTSGGESPTPLNSMPINGATYTDENVSAGADYYYLVTSVTANGDTQSAASEETAVAVPSP
jgi:hypothetical protein